MDGVGVRFKPTPVEIVKDLLKRKLQMIHDENPWIPDVDIYQYDPGELCAIYNEISGKRSTDSQSYFFCPPKKSKAAGDGFWYETSKPRFVNDEETGEVIGMKRYYTFCYGNRNHPRRSDWTMHEYHLKSSAADHTIADPTAFVLCHVKKKDRKYFTKSSSKKRGSKSGDSSIGEAEVHPSTSIDTPGVSEVTEARETNSEGSAFMMKGPELAVPEPSPIVSIPPVSEHDDVGLFLELDDLETDIGDVETMRNAAISAEMISPLPYDDTMVGARGSEAKYAPSYTDVYDGFPLDINSTSWGWN